MKQANLTIEKAKEMASWKSELEKSEIDSEKLKYIALAAKKFGKEILKTLNEFEGLQELLKKKAEIRKEIEEVKRIRENISSEITDLQQKLDNLKNELIDKQGMLNVYDKLIKAGYSESDLNMILVLARKFGQTEKLIAALEEFEKLEDLKRKSLEVENQLKMIEAKLEEEKAKYAYLISAISMTHELIFKKSLGIDRIKLLLTIAEKFGRPVDVFEAFPKYAEKKEIEREISELNKKVLEIKAFIQKQEGEIKNNEIMTQTRQQKLEEIEER
ncbi:MAG: hypothetical protein QW472_03805 [Candidatus Aenigmatarchaeota archaeon]